MKAKNEKVELPPILSEEEISAVQELETTAQETPEKENTSSCKIEFVTSPDGKRKLQVSGNCTADEVMSKFDGEVEEVELDGNENSHELGEEEPSEIGALKKVTVTEKREYIALPGWVIDLLKRVKK